MTLSVEQVSLKRLLQTSDPYPSTEEALDAASANVQMDGCDYSFVDSKNRVVAVFEYHDVHPDRPVASFQDRVLIPNYPSSSGALSAAEKAERYDQILAVAGNHKLRLVDPETGKMLGTVTELHHLLDHHLSKRNPTR